MKKEKITTAILVTALIVALINLFYQKNKLLEMERNFYLQQEQFLDIDGTSWNDTLELDEWETDTTKLSTSVIITKYQPLESQCDSDPLITADLSEINLDRLKENRLKWVAVSRDLLKKYKFGSRIILETGDESIDGEYEVHDTMNPRWTNRVDILIHPDHNPGKGKWKGKLTLS